MASTKNIRRGFAFLIPHLPAFCTSIPLSFLIAGIDSVCIWLIGTMPSVLLGKPMVLADKPPILTFATLNEVLKFHTYHLLTHAGGLSPLAAVCLLIVALYTIKNIITYFNNILNISVFTGVIRDMRDKMYAHLLRMKTEYFDRSDSGSIVSIMLNDIEKLKQAVTSSVQQIVIEPVKVIISLVLLIAISWQLTLVIFIVYPLFGYLIVAVGKSVKRRSTRELTSFSDSISHLSETIAGIRIVKMFNAVNLETESYRKLNNRYTALSRNNERMKMVLSPFSETIAMYVTSGLLLFGGTLASGTIKGFSTDDFVRFLVILVLSYRPIKNLAGVNSTVQNGMAAADRFFEVADRTEEILDSSVLPVSFANELRFTDVWFRYPQTEPWVLRGVSFSVKRGEMVAIVGSSGAGKSTILDLIPRLYDYDKGSITIDGTDIKTIPIYGLRNLLGTVTQDNFLFNGDVKDNISYGAQADEEKVLAAARAANALEFIDRLPAKIHTVIGERGISLSGGQRQRLAIARALYRNVPIIIFDEATSALDTESERLVQTAIDGIAQGRTVIVVAHRLSTVKHADRIIVLENGVVVESGKHDQLVSLNGRYKKLCDLQFV